MSTKSPNYRLPFDLPPASDYEVLIDQAEFAAMLMGDEASVDAATLIAECWTARADKTPANEPPFGILIPRRYGLTAMESRNLGHDAEKVRAVTLAIYELVDKIATEAGDGREVAEIHNAILTFGDTKYMPPYLRPYLAELMSLDTDSTQTYSEKLATIHMQRAIPAWAAEHTASIRSGLADGLMKFAGLEDGLDDEKKV